MVDGKLINCTFLVHNSINIDKDAMQPQPIFKIWINYSISAVATGFQSSFVSNLASFCHIDRRTQIDEGKLGDRVRSHRGKVKGTEFSTRQFLT